MKVQALTAFSLGGGRDVAVGEIFEVSDEVAVVKIRQGWVKLAPLKRGKAEHPEAGAEDAHSTVPEMKTRDPEAKPHP